MSYIERHLEKRIAEALSVHPALVLTGPRQVGKVTLLENASFFQGWRYLTLDDPDVLDQAREDPKGLLLDDVPTIIDEVQRCPQIIVSVKYYVDRSGRKRKFVLSGSGNVSLRREPRESLAGRAQYLSLTPFSVAETLPAKRRSIFLEFWQDQPFENYEIAYTADYQQAVWKGGLPGIWPLTEERKIFQVMESYVGTYLERDIQDLLRVRHPEHFRLLMEALAKATGWETKQDELGKVCHEERSNISRYMTLLKETELLIELPGYAVKNERSYRRAKYYWFDAGIASYLAGIVSPKDLDGPSCRGRYFENFVLQQILAYTSLQIVPFQLFYWKPKSQEGEVNFVVRRGGKVLPVEVKSASTLTFRDTRTMRAFLSRHPEARAGLIAYTGNTFYQIASNIFAVPWTEL